MDELEELAQMYNTGDGAQRFKQYDAGTPDPIKYHDPSQVTLLGSGRTLGSVLSGGPFGLRGIVIPRSKAEGGSMGFDPHAPQKCIVDPGMTATPIVVDFAKLSRSDVQTACAEASAAPLTTAQDRGLLAFMKMSKMTLNPTHQAPMANPSSGFTSRTATFGSLPPTPPPSVQPPQPRTVAPPEVPVAAPFTGSIRDALSNSQRPSAPPPTVRRLRVDFELPRPMGTLTGYYHRVIRTGELLILVYDHNAEPTSQLWFPTAPEADETPYELPMLVYDETGVPDTAFFAQPTPARFIDNGVEYSILAVSQEKYLKEGKSHGNGEARRNLPGLDATGGQSGGYDPRQDLAGKQTSFGW